MSESESNPKASLSLNTTITPSNAIQQRRRMVRDCSLLCLDECMDEANQEYQNILTQLKINTDNVNIFKQRDECIDFLTDVEENIKFFLVLENTMAQHIVPLINGIPQLDGVYIVNDTKILHEKWTTKWQKIKSVHNNIDDLCKVLQLNVKRCNQDSIAMSFLTVDEMISTDSLNQLDPTFMYTQIFKEIILDMEHGKQAIKEFTTYCRQNNSGSSTNIDGFENKYHTQSAIWWYTSPLFIYSMLNYALRSMEGDIIINMGFFIHDLHQQIQQLHQQQLSSYQDKPFIVYRGQGLSKANFEKLQKTSGALLSFNSFLSTSTEQSISLVFAQSASYNVDNIGVLFKILIDPRVKSVPFASIDEVSYYNEEKEILFSMHTVFRVNAIQKMDNSNQLYQVELQLTSDDDQELRLLTDRIREEADGTGWQGLSKLLIKIGQFNKAEELYNVLLEQTSDESGKALYYNQLGTVKHGQGDYEKAILYYEQGLEIDQKALPSNHPDLATSYNNIGLVYKQMGEYTKALLSHEKAHEILEKTLPSNHPSLATSYNNIGGVYENIGEYSKALSSHEKALEIDQKALTSNHPDLATSYNNIGIVYDKTGQYLKALSFYEKALEIRQKNLPSNHPSLATSYNNIGTVYDTIGEYSNSLSFYEQGLKIQQKTLPLNHPDLATSYNNIGGLYDTIGEYSNSLSFYEQGLKIQQKTLPSNHPDLASSYNNIGGLYESIGEYSKALLSHEKAHEILEKTLPSNHPSLATSYNNIGGVYDKMGEYSKALSSHEKALEIRQKTLPSNHPSLATSYNNIGLVYNHMGEFSKALSFYEKAHEIQEKTLSSNHPHLATSYNNIGSVYTHMGQYWKALSFYEKALEIRQRTLPLNHPDLATSYNNIAGVYYNIKDYSKALSYFERALDIFQHALPPAHPHIKSVTESIDVVKKKL